MEKVIGALKRCNNSLGVDDKEKANLMNTFFSSFGEILAISIEPRLFRSTTAKVVPQVTEFSTSSDIIDSKLKLLKPRKATGQDGI